MIENWIEKKTQSFCCEYCGFAQAGRNAYENVKYHENNCSKNPAVISAAKKAVGKMYKTQNNSHYVKVLKFNENSSPREYLPEIVEGGFLPKPPILRPEYQKYPLTIKEIDFGTWKTYKDWKEGLGYPANITVCLRASAMLNFENMIEITQDEWDAAIKRIADEDRECNVGTN